jgi:hypothetical protein
MTTNCALVCTYCNTHVTICSSYLVFEGNKQSSNSSSSSSIVSSAASRVLMKDHTANVTNKNSSSSSSSSTKTKVETTLEASKGMDR